jgi:hypothetical protein
MVRSHLLKSLAGAARNQHQTEIEKPKPAETLRGELDGLKGGRPRG